MKLLIRGKILCGRIGCIYQYAELLQNDVILCDGSICNIRSNLCGKFIAETVYMILV